VTVLGVLEFQADRDFYYRAIYGINLEDCLAGVMWAIQAVCENAVPLRNAAVLRFRPAVSVRHDAAGSPCSDPAEAIHIFPSIVCYLHSRPNV